MTDKQEIDYETEIYFLEQRIIEIGVKLCNGLTPAKELIALQSELKQIQELARKRKAELQ